MIRAFYLWTFTLGPLVWCLTGCSTNDSVAGTDFPNTISGVMVDSSDATVANAMAILIRPKGPGSLGTHFSAFWYDTVYTDREGKFRFEDINEGDYALEGRVGTSLITYAGSLAKGEDELHLEPLVMRKPGFLEGMVETPGGLDIYCVIKGTHFYDKADETGNFFLSVLPPGELEMDITIHNNLNGKRTVAATQAATIKPGLKTSASPEKVPIASLWTYAQTIKLNTTAAGANIAKDVYDIPILVRLDGINFSFGQAQSDGRDVRFVKPDGSALPFEMEYWDPTAPAATFWVGMDTVYGNSETAIEMYWGTDYAREFSRSGDVFDTAHAFIGVWHYGDDPSGPAPQMKDATFYGSHGTVVEDMPGGRSVDANIGCGLLFDGNTGYISMDGAVSRLNNGDAVTVSTWFKALNNSLTYFITGGVDTEDGNVFRLGLHNDGRITVSTRRNKEESGSSSYWDDRWHYVSVSFDSLGHRKVYVNGAEIPGYVIVDPPPFSSMTNLVSGAEFDAGAVTNRYRGVLDELRISRALRSEDWIKLNYENQKPNQTLIEFIK